MSRTNHLLAGALLALTMTACDDDGGGNDGQLEVPSTYTFESRYEPGVSSVSYSGQTMRHVLIMELTAYVGGLNGAIDAGTLAPAEGDVADALAYYLSFDSAASGDDPVTLTTTPAHSGATWNGISTDKDLFGKLAGNDSSTDWKDWDGGGFQGWSDASIAQHGGSIDSPQGLVTAFVETLDAAAVARANGTVAQDPDGNDLPVHVTAEGRDLQQLLQKVLTMAVTFSQTADDYLDDDIDGKGILSPNTRASETAAYTALEHAWDEGFGYFGAARDYADYTDDELAGASGRDGWVGYHDTDGDGTIDLTAEYNFGLSTNAAKRDRGASASAPTDLTAEAFSAFVEGRAIIAAAPEGEDLDAATLAALTDARDRAVLAMEKAAAATAVHYINDTLQDMGRFGTDDYAFTDHAKHWSELKGFAIGLQFNPRSPMNADFATFHGLIGDAPVLASATAAEIAQYEQDLVAARDLLQAAYGFAEANMGDDDGQGGW